MITEKRKAPERVVEKVICVPVKKIIPFEEQPRDYFNEEKLNSLVSSIKEFGQAIPGEVIELPNGFYELIDGQRRWHAIQIAGLTHMNVTVKTGISNKSDQFTASVLANFPGERHTHLEIARAIKRFRSEGKRWRTIANLFGFSEASAINHLKVLDLHPDVLAMLSPEIPKNDERLVFTVAVELTKLPEDIQREVAQVILEKRLGTVQAKALIKKRAKKEGTYVTSPGHSPRKDYKKLVNFMNGAILSTEVFVSEPQRFFDEMFLHRKAEDCRKMAESLEIAINNMGSLYKAVLKAQVVKDDFDKKTFHARLDAKVTAARSRPGFDEVN